MGDTIVKRPYRSPLRAAQAEATRQRILETGLALFAERGYQATSVTEIARAAEVAPETIYASVGSKRGIIDGLLARVETERIADRASEAVAARGGTPRVAVSVMAERSAQFWLEHRALVRVLRAGVGDPEIGEAWLERQTARRGILRTLVSRWPRTALAPGLDVERAADIAWALTSDDVYALFVEIRRWPFEAFVAWLGSALERELLADPPDRAPA